MLGFFTSDVAILSEAGSYLQIIKYTFLLYLVTQVLLSALRSVETVRIAFVISCVSLVYFNLRTIWLSRVGNSWGSNWHDAIEMFRVPYCTYLCSKNR